MEEENRYKRVETFESNLHNEKAFIKAMYDYIYNHIPSPESYEVIECIRAIFISNLIQLDRQQTTIDELRQIISSAKPIEEPEIKDIPFNQTKKVPRDDSSDEILKEYISLVLYTDSIEEIKLKLSNLSKINQIRLKLKLRQIILQEEKKIKNMVLTSGEINLTEIKNLKRKIAKLNQIIKLISNVEKNEEQEAIEIVQKGIKIIIVPNGEKSSYLFQDISEYLNSKKEIKNIFDKLIDGYFLKTKDTKQLNGYQNLYEYKHPNGIRILYVVDGDTINICSLFYKDKQRSIKISNYYDEALRRYDSQKEYILQNLDNPDFFIIQDELIGEINTILESGYSLKKVMPNE